MGRNKNAIEREKELVAIERGKSLGRTCACGHVHEEEKQTTKKTD